MTGPDCAVMCNLINTHTHTHIQVISLIPPWEDQCEWHRMTRMTGPDCAVMCNLINTHKHTYREREREKPNRGRSGQFMGCPSGGRGPSRERDRNPTSRSGSRRRGEGRGGEGRERGGGERGGRGGGGVGQREQWDDPLVTQPGREIELSQTNRGVGGVCVRVVLRVQTKLSRALHAHRGKKLLQDLQTQENAAIKRAMVRFRGAREKRAMALFVECLGFSQEDTMEGPLWRETLGRSLGSHDATELVGGMCHGNG